MTNLDELMSRDPLSLSDQDLAEIISYHRTQRARRAAGEKPKKPVEPSEDISDLRAKLMPKPEIKLVRRV